ncbi:hypothetical protein Q0M59_17475, partial [Staphylococcus aureus]|nr:hypothetical protein [Staphylococcus aureus]
DHDNDRHGEYASPDKQDHRYQNGSRHDNHNYNDEDYNRSVHLGHHHDTRTHQHHYYDNQYDDIDYASLYTQNGDYSQHDKYNDRARRDR